MDLRSLDRELTKIGPNFQKMNYFKKLSFKKWFHYKMLSYSNNFNRNKYPNNKTDFWHRKLTLKIKFWWFLSPHTQVNASPITKIISWLEFLGKNLNLVGCATVCGKSEVMLMYVISGVKSKYFARGWSNRFSFLSSHPFPAFAQKRQNSQNNV